MSYLKLSIHTKLWKTFQPKMILLDFDDTDDELISLYLTDKIKATDLSSYQQTSNMAALEFQLQTSSSISKTHLKSSLTAYSGAWNRNVP